MNVLQIASAVAYEMGLIVPTTIEPASINNSNAFQLLHCMYGVSRYLRNQRAFPQQKRIHTFSTVANQGKYQLPRDFYGAIFETEWNNDEQRRLNGPLPDNLFTYRLYNNAGSSINFDYRVFGPDSNYNGTGAGQFWIYPTPTSVVELSFEYITKNLFLPKYWAASTAFAAGAYCSASGNIYYTSGGGTTGSTIPSHASSSASDGVVTWIYQTAAYETVIDDEDMSMFDDDIMIAGTKYYVLRARGHDFQHEYNEFRSMIDAAVTRWHGSYRGSMVGAGGYKTQNQYSIINVAEGFTLLTEDGDNLELEN